MVRCVKDWMLQGFTGQRDFARAPAVEILVLVSLSIPELHECGTALAAGTAQSHLGDNLANSC